MIGSISVALIALIVVVCAFAHPAGTDVEQLPNAGTGDVLLKESNAPIKEVPPETEDTSKNESTNKGAIFVEGYGFLKFFDTDLYNAKTFVTYFLDGQIKEYNARVSYSTGNEVQFDVPSLNTTLCIQCVEDMGYEVGEEVVVHCVFSYQES